MKKMNKKGFTLIELLAVIIILGVLLLIAVPSVSRYIKKSKLDAYSNSLSSFVDAVKNDVNAGIYSIGKAEVLVVPFAKIELEKGSNTKSSFAEYNTEYSFVLVYRKEDSTTKELLGYEYLVQAQDNEGYGITLGSIFEVTGVVSDTKLVKIPENGDLVKDNEDLSDIPHTATTKFKVIS